VEGENAAKISVANSDSLRRQREAEAEQCGKLPVPKVQTASD
jgi:flotillin